MGPFLLETRRIKMPDKDRYKAGQDFYIPITNRFDVLTFEIVSYVTTGLFQGQQKYFIIKEYHIPVPTLNKRESLPIKFYLNPKEDFKKLKMSGATAENVLNFFGMGDKKKELPRPYFEVEIQELSGLLTDVAFNPNRDIVEDRARVVKFNQKQIELIGAKFLLAYYNILDIENLERLIFFFKYPQFSKFMRIFLVLFVIQFDPSHLLSYLIAMIIIIVFFNNEEWIQEMGLQPIIHRLFLYDLNPYIDRKSVV